MSSVEFVHSHIGDHLEAGEEELISDEGRQKCLANQTSDHLDEGILSLEVVRGGPSEIEIFSDVFDDVHQLHVPVVVVEHEIGNLALSNSVVEHRVVKLSPEFKIVPSDVGSEGKSCVENDSKLFLGTGILGALDVKGQPEATLRAVTDEDTLSSGHADGLRVLLLGEGEGAIAGRISTIVVLEFGEKEEDLAFETLTGESLLKIVERSVDS